MIDRTPISSKEIEEYLKSDDDFRFELKVRNACLRARSVDHSGTYVDPVTSKTRQFDIRARWEFGRKLVQMAIECKCLQRYAPLVVSRVPRRPQESFHQVMHIWPNTGHTNMRISNSWHKEDAPVGKSTLQLRREIPKGREKTGRLVGKREFQTDDGVMFDKWTQAFGSADDLIAAGFRFARESEAFVLVIPAVVIPDETLWAIDYTEDSEGQMQQQEPRQVPHVSLYVEKDLPLNYCVSHLEFFTFTGFRQFVGNLNGGTLVPHFLFPQDQIDEQKLPRPH